MKNIRVLLVVFIFDFGFLLEYNVERLMLPQPELTQEMRKYLTATKVKLSAFDDTVGIVTDHEIKCQYLLDYLLKYKTAGPVYIANPSGSFLEIPSVHTDPTENLICILEGLESIEDVMEHINTNPFFNKRGLVRFIVLTVVEDREWLNSTLNFIWEQKVLNFVIIYQIRENMEVIGYNPFNQRYYNFTNKSVDKMFPDKLQNMHGVPIRVDVILDKTTNTQGKPQGDANWVKIIQTKLNVKINLVYKSNFWEIQRSLRNEESNFSLTSHFSFASRKYLVENGYPSRMDYIVAVAPTGNLTPQYQYLFQVFNETLWIILLLIVIAICIITIILIKVERDHRSATDAVFWVVQYFLSQPNSNADSAPLATKTLIMCWMFFCILLSACFSSFLRSSLMSLKFDDSMDTMEQLKESGLKILLENYVRNNIEELFPSIASQFETVDDVTEVMLKYSRETAFITQKSSIEYLVNKRDRNNRNIYHILKEFLMSGHSVYNYAEHSPLLDKIDTLMLRSREYGLVMYRSSRASGRVIAASNHASLQMIHLQTTFYMWGFGLLAGAIVFVGEKVHYNKNKPKFSFVR